MVGVLWRHSCPGRPGVDAVTHRHLAGPGAPLPRNRPAPPASPERARLPALGRASLWDPQTSYRLGHC